MNDSSINKQGVRLREARRALKLTQTEVAEALNVKQAHISRIEAGLNSISFAQAKRIEEKFNVSAYYLLEGKGSLTGSIEEQFTPSKIEGAILPSFKDINQSFEVYSDSMEPEFRKGDLVLCARLKSPEKGISKGGLYYIVTERYRIFRQVRDIREGKYLLYAYDPKTSDVEVRLEEIQEVYSVKFNLRSYE